jgi:hypothetical protein
MKALFKAAVAAIAVAAAVPAYAAPPAHLPGPGPAYPPTSAITLHCITYSWNNQPVTDHYRFIIQINAGTERATFAGTQAQSETRMTNELAVFDLPNGEEVAVSDIRSKVSWFTVFTPNLLPAQGGMCSLAPVADFWG